ncbi:MAG: hypothetical protein R3C30_07375 [Hyphomonadaceae bacterium]
MILRRLMEHLRKQEWTAVAIDFVIVVVGVFVGMQVTNWNADAADRRRGAEYVERLSRDMEKDLAARRNNVAYYAAVLDSVLRANSMLADPRSNPRDLVVNAYRATEMAYSAPTRATWDELVSSGDIGLLPRGAVDRGIADYFAVDTGQSVIDTMEASAYRHRVRSIIPLEVQVAIRAGCSDVRSETAEVVGFVEACTLDVSDDVLRETANALRADPEVRATLRMQYSDAYTARANLSGDVAYLERGLAALRGS